MRFVEEISNKNKLIVMVIFIFSVVILNLRSCYIYADTLPTFAVVESESKNVKSNENKKENIKQDKENVPAIAQAEFKFVSAAQILMEASTGQVIYENNSDEKHLPASVTKVMTLLLTMEAIDSGKISYEDKVVCSEHASSMGGSQIWFKVGEELTMEEALKCICVVSANDVSIAVAEMIGGNEENFVKMMNDKARELGMNNTNFMNAHGIDEENHYTTARDIAIMSRELITKHPDILKYTSIWMDTIRGGTFDLSNTNKLIRYYEGANGLKTGSTSQALFNVSATATKNNMTLIAVIIKAPTSDIRNEEAKQLLNFGFTNYEVQEISKEGDLVKTQKVNKYLSGEVEFILKEGVSLLNEKGKKEEILEDIQIESKLQAPLNKNEKVGEIIYTNKQSEIIKKVDLISKNNIQKSNLWDYILQSLKTYSLM